MKVLILGANGMLGHALQDAFASHNVIPWDRDDLDIVSCSAVRAHIPELKPDIVLNAAAYTDVERAEEERDIAERVNGCAVGAIAQVCKTIDVPLLHISTDYVFGDEGGEYDEEIRPHAPLNSYGTSKLLGEELVREHADKYWIVRTSWLFGEHGKNFISTMLQLGARQDRVSVVGDQEGCPTYTPDLAGAIEKLIADNAPYGVYHLTNSGTATWAELAETAFRAAGMNTAVERITSEEFAQTFHAHARRPHRSVLWNTKRPSLRSWHEAVNDYVPVKVNV